MVKKLFKYEFIYYFRTLGLFLPVVPVLGLMVRIFRFFDEDSIIRQLAVGSSGILCYVGALALMISATIVGVIRFYKNLYSAEGYLSFTLPVSTTQHILVKLVTQMAFDALVLLSVGIGALIALSGEAFAELLWEIVDAFSVFPPVHGFFYGLEFLLLFVISIASTYLLYYACITIGQTAKKNRILMAVGVYFIYYMITQVVSTVIMILFTVLGTLGVFDAWESWLVENGFAVVHLTLIGAIVICAVLSAVYFLITRYVMTKKLNLE